MNQRNENFSMILEVLENINMKPNKESLSYVDKFIQSNGGYKQYYDSYNEYKIQKERSELINAMLEAKNKGLKTQAPVKKEVKHYHCDTMEEYN